MIYRLLAETEQYLREIGDASIEPDRRVAAKDFAEICRAEASQPALLSQNKSRSVRGLRDAPLLFDAGLSPGRTPLFEAALDAFPYARWSEFYEESPWSQPFIGSFATGECIGPAGRLQSTDIILGLFILGPGIDYPPHAHAAEECYIVVAGEAEFQIGAQSDFVVKREGDVVFHGSHISHAIRTSSRPMFAVYVWRGALSEPSWYRNDMTDETEPRKYPKLL
ncbi:dimethylsulfonioproprionate lyase family protein [Pseudochelatococcus sp. B33]